MAGSDRHIWVLLARYMAGEASRRQEKEIEVWRGSGKNNELFNQVKNDWNSIGIMKNQFNVDNAWGKLHEKIESGGQLETDHAGLSPIRNAGLQNAGPSPIRNAGLQNAGHSPIHDAGLSLQTKPPWHRTGLLKIAASVVFVIAAAGLALYISFYRGVINISTSENAEIRKVDLPDGSAVYLNSGSEISYSGKYPEKGRRINLEGEAFFEVAADASNPFIIEVNGAMVKAVGTSFNVSQGEKKQNVKVFVKTGKVELSNLKKSQDEIILTPGYLGIMDGTSVESLKTDDSNEIAWMTHNMKFEDTEMSEVLIVLEDVYKVNIELQEPWLDTIRIFGEFLNDPLDEVLEVISTTNNLTVIKEDERIILTRAR